MKKTIGFSILLLGIVIGGSILFFFAGTVPEAKNVVWGVNFSKKHTEDLGLDWKETYTALLEDLGVKKVKISVDWNEIEKERNAFLFDDIDWQITESERLGTELMLVVGMKTMRWPECHVPMWAKDLSKEEQQEEVLQLLKAVVTRYKDSTAITAWQVENEPLLRFGNCPWVDKDFLIQEIAMVRDIDPSRPIVISDSGEFSFWVQAARLADIPSTTMYRKVWFHEANRYVEYPLPATFYGRKAQIIKKVFGKDVIGGELQAEPWGPGKLLYETTVSEQDEAFDLMQFRKNLTFAKKTGIAVHYLWGAEWWYWRKEKAHDPSFWTEAKKLFID